MLNQERPGMGEYHVTDIAPGALTINYTDVHHTPLLITANGVTALPIQTTADLDESVLKGLIAERPSVVIIGTGTTGLIDDALIKSLQAQQIGCEMMDTSTACFTYEALLSEGRSVAAVLIP